MIRKSSAGKGDVYRPVNKKVYDRNWNNIFHKSKINYENIVYTVLRILILLLLLVLTIYGCTLNKQDILREEYQRYNQYYDN